MNLFKITLLILFISVSKIYCQNIQFYREDLTFEIKDNYFSVNGFYNFCNNIDTDIKQILFYPFPTDSLYGAVDSIIVSELNGEVNKSFNVKNNTKKGFYFKIELKGYGVNKYKISYRQKLYKNKAEYILLSTQKWGTPFDYAFYKLIISESVKINSVSYYPDSIINSDNKMIYYWAKRNFMPDRNMIIYFDNKNKN